MTFAFGARSMQRLVGVHPDLVKVVNLALQLSPIDFSVLEGIRTAEQEAAMVAKGASKTMHSRHLTGHAVDVGAVEGVNWDTAPVLALAVRDAALDLGILIEWGGVWDRKLNILGDNMLAEHVAYVTRARASGIKSVLEDGPHFQLPWKEYPA